MIENVTVPAKRCTCDVCRHQWLSLAAEPPLFCPNKKCPSRRLWNGPKRVNRTDEIKFPAPRDAGRPKRTDSDWFGNG